MYCGWCEECVESEWLIGSVLHGAYCPGSWTSWKQTEIRWVGPWQEGPAYQEWLDPLPSLPHPRYLTAADLGNLTNLGGNLYRVVRKSQGNGFTHELVA